MKTSKNKTLNRRILSSSTSVVISLSLVLFVVGLLGLVLINAQKLSDYVKENIGFTIMLKDGVNEIETLKFQKILDASDFAKSTSFTTKEQATADLKTDLGEDFVEFLGYSPLLASIDVKLNAEYGNTDSLQIITNELSENANVFEVYYQERFNRQTQLKCKSLVILFTYFLCASFLYRFCVN